MYKVLIIIATLFYSCSNEPSIDFQDFEKINFNVNTNLISDPIIFDDSFVMSVPNIVFKNSDAFNALNDLSKIYNNCNHDINECSNNQDFIIKKRYGKMTLIGL